MMNYHAKFNIAECSFNKITNPAFVGIFSYEHDRPPLSLDIEVKVRRSITIGSYVGGGAGFPSNEHAEIYLTEEHGDLLEAYLKTIPQDRLCFFEDGSLVSMGMLMTLLKVAKKCSKHVTCFGLEPDAYEGKKRLARFNHSWEVINELSDESHRFDFSSSDIDRKLRVVVFRALRWHVALKQLRDMESGLDVYDYYAKPHQNDWTPRSFEWRVSE
jgi:hypothetical protein